jgi:hypothetical protein
MTLENDADVKTFSVGDGAVRTVVIAPKNELPESEQRPPRRSGPPRRASAGGERPREQAPSDSPNGDNRGPRRSSRRGGRGRRRRGPGAPREESKVTADTSDTASGERNDS